MERKDSKRWTPELVHGNDHGRLVDYILLAEFDIDTGSTVRHIFPKPIPNYSNDYFADYMLPEGAHNRDSDHTFIFLNRDAPQSDNPYVNHTENILIHTNTNINSSMMISSDHIGNSSSIVTSSITNTTTIDVTKKDDDNNNNSNSAADDNNDNSNTNNHNNGNNDKEGNSISNSNNNENTNANTSTNKKKPYFLYGLNIVKRKHNSNVRRGAIVKAMAIFSRYHYLELFKKPLDQALELYFQASDNTITNNTNDNSPHSNSANTTEQLTILKSLYGALNSIDLTSLPKPNYLELNLMRRGIKYDSIIRNNMNYYFPKAWIEKVHCYFNGKSIPLSVHLYRTNDEIGDIHVTKLLKVFGENTMRIFHSILTKQKVLFVGYNHAASDVAGMVLSAIAMIAPPLHNIIRRVYPYANLSDLSFLEVSIFLFITITVLLLLSLHHYYDYSFY